jgi:hypothetical protein
VPHTPSAQSSPTAFESDASKMDVCGFVSLSLSCVCACVCVVGAPRKLESGGACDERENGVATLRAAGGYA